jgi:phosphocarrier protein
MQEVTLVVTHEVGLHARPAAQFVSRAKQFASAITVCKDDTEVNAKSILKILTLGVNQGTVIRVRAQGEDEAEAIQALKELVESNFAEPSKPA